MTSEKRHPDSDVKVGVFVWLGVALMALVAVAMVLMWMLTADLNERQIALDPPPPLLEEARQPHIPPEPRLQAEPFADMDALRRADETRLNSYGWVEGSAESAHIPIDVAMDLLVEQGLPQPEEAATQADEPQESN